MLVPIGDMLRVAVEQQYAIGVPLVLHGGSSTGDERLKKSIEHGVAKINIYTDMSTEAKHRLKSALEEGWDRVRYNDLVDVAKGAFKDVASHYMRLFGSAGRG
jgi:fructose-bisphosphate aldolase class II